MLCLAHPLPGPLLGVPPAHLLELSVHTRLRAPWSYMAWGQAHTGPLLRPETHSCCPLNADIHSTHMLCVPSVAQGPGGRYKGEALVPLGFCPGWARPDE